MYKSVRSELSPLDSVTVKWSWRFLFIMNSIISDQNKPYLTIKVTDWNLKTIWGFVLNQYMICDTNLIKNPLSHHDTPVFSVNFTFRLIITGSDTINCQIFQSWFYLKVELGKRINLVSDWEEGRTQSKWQSQRVMVQPSGRIGLTSVRKGSIWCCKEQHYSGWCPNIETESIKIISFQMPTCVKIKTIEW